MLKLDPANLLALTELCTIGDKILWSSFFCHFKTN
jgi:hypothetical protein